MSTLKILMEMGKELGYSGSELQTFVREEQARERDERRIEREVEKQIAEREHELALIREKQEAAEKEMLLQRKIEHEREERAVKEHERKMELLDKQASQESKPSFTHPLSVPSIKAPKLPAFDENTDNMDSYLQRFERYATTQGWDKALQWAPNLSVLLKGRALDVFSRMPIEQSLDYDALKDALLKRFEMTEEGFRKRFREGRPEQGETFSQFSVRLESYLVRWVELGKVLKTYEGLLDLVVRDQFLQACSQELKLFLKERTPSSLKEMAKLADQFVEARPGNASNFVYKQRVFNNKTLPTNASSQSSNSSNSTRAQNTQQSSQSGKSKPAVQPDKKHCYICKSIDHLAFKCPQRKRSNQASAISTQQGFDDKDTQPKSDDVSLLGGKTDVEKSNPLSASCDFVVSDSMPVSKGYVGENVVTVLRDTGCSGVVVRRSLVSCGQLTGETQNCTLANGDVLSVPVAKIWIDTPFFVGEVSVWCMDKPIYDLILGNVNGVRQPNDPNPDWKVRNDNVSAVQTRAQKNLEDRPYRPLRVPKALLTISTPAEMKEAQESDRSLSKLREYVEKGDVKERKGGGSSRYYIQKGLLYREFKSPAYLNGKVLKQLVVPKTYRSAVMELAHNSIMSGHLGTKKTSNRVSLEFFWPGMTSDITRFCRSCDACQRTFPKGKVAKVPLGNMPLIDTPFQRVAVDIVGPLTPVTDRGNRFILTIVDYATRYPEAVALKGIDTERVAEALVDVYSRVGIPREVLTDQGSQFTSEVMREVSRLLSIRQLTTTPYHPMCNGLVEKFNGTLKQMLKRMCTERPRDWDKYINALLFAYREVPQDSLGFSPFEMLYGRTVRGPMMILKELWTKDVSDPDVKTTYQYVVDLRERLEETCSLAREQMKSAKARQAKYYNKKARERKLQIGQKVLVLLPTKKNKLLMQWKGPYVVTEKKGSMDYVLNVDGKSKTLHINLLRPYVEREESEKSHGALTLVCNSIIEVETDDYEDVPCDEAIIVPSKVRSESAEDVLVSELLSSEQSREVTKFLNQFDDVLTDVPGKTNLAEHDIQTTTREPVRVKEHSIPYNMKATIKSEVDKMLQMGVIEASDSPFSAPVVIVRKKDGSNRFCIDYRQLNRVTIFDAEPMPNADDIFARLADHQYFSRLDLSKGYWQVPMSETSKQKTAFSTPVGLFQFSVMPFGLVNAPATFCRLMRKLLDGMTNIESFIDDILIYTKTWNQHVNVLKELFRRLRKAGLTARPSKCAIGFRSLECLGHIVGEQRLLPNPDKVKAIGEASRPETKKQVRSFLGMAGFYRKFIPNFSSIAVPLTDLTKKGQPNKVIWEQPQEIAFTTLKKMLTSTPILKLPDLQKEFVLQTDASDQGIGAVLLQTEDENIFPVAYASRKLKTSEQSYSVIEKECLAVVWAIQKFQKYIYGKEFVLETDHQPLLYLNKLKGSNARLMRWALQLQPYRFRIRAIKGSENVGADFLSRS